MGEEYTQFDTIDLGELTKLPYYGITEGSSLAGSYQ
jgi:hypothetical protein